MEDNKSNIRRGIAILLTIVLMGCTVPLAAQEETPSEPTENESNVFIAAWQGVGQVFQTLGRGLLQTWHDYVEPFFMALWDSIRDFLQHEIEIRTPGVQEEFERETKAIKDELKEVAPKAGKNLWERFKDLFRRD